MAGSWLRRFPTRTRKRSARPAGSRVLRPALEDLEQRLLLYATTGTKWANSDVSASYLTPRRVRACFHAGFQPSSRCGGIVPPVERVPDLAVLANRGNPHPADTLEVRGGGPQAEWSSTNAVRLSSSRADSMAAWAYCVRACSSSFSQSTPCSRETPKASDSD